MSDRSESKLDVFDDIVRKPQRSKLEPGSGVQRAPEDPAPDPPPNKADAPSAPPPARPPPPAIAPRPRARAKPVATPANRAGVTTTATSPNGSAKIKVWLLVAGGAILLVALALITIGGARPRAGTLVVSVSGPAGRVLPSVETYVDGTRRCATSPCRIEGLSRGVHIVEARAPQHLPIAGKAVKVEADDEVPFDIELQPRDAATAPPPPKVETKAPPAPLAELGAASAPTAGPRTTSSGAPSSSLAPARLPPAPGSASAASTAAPTVAAGVLAPPPAAATAAPNASATAPTAQGRLNINSIPASNVVVDGRPLGRTPVIGVSVAPGTHSVVFIHPEQGRKVTQVSVAAGQTSTATTQFP